jgi:hypothetical protein
LKRTGVKKVLAKVIALLLTVTVLTVSAVARGGWRQDDPVKPLRLDGKVVDVKVERDGQNRIFHLKLKLRFTNTGEEPVILLLGAYGEKKDWWVFDKTLSRTLTDALDGKPFFISPTGPANSKSLPVWKELRRTLNSSQPPSTLTERIQPNGMFFREIETLVVIREDDRIAPGSRVWLKVFLELWPLNIEPVKHDERSRPYGESLRRKWQAFGDLQLDPILSSPIPLDLPPWE